MDRLSDRAIILSRTNYREADRILTVITKEGEKLTIIAKGVRKLKSKLAGGIELFSESELGYLKGRGQMVTLLSARTIKQYKEIVKDINRTMFGYEVLKLVNRVTEDHSIGEYYDLMSSALAGLDDIALDLNLVKSWTYYKLLVLYGHQPNIYRDSSGAKLSEGLNYDFDISSMSLVEADKGVYDSKFIKLLRFIDRVEDSTKLKALSGVQAESLLAAQLLHKMIKFNL